MNGPKRAGSDLNPAEGRKRQVRKTSSKGVLTLSLWSKSRRPRRWTKRPQSPSVSTLPRSFFLSRPPKEPAQNPFYFSLHLHINSAPQCSLTQRARFQLCTQSKLFHCDAINAAFCSPHVVIVLQKKYINTIIITLFLTPAHSKEQFDTWNTTRNTIICFLEKCQMKRSTPLYL